MDTLELGRVAKVGDICFVTLYLLFLNDHPLFDILMRRSFDYLAISVFTTLSYVVGVVVNIAIFFG